MCMWAYVRGLMDNSYNHHESVGLKADVRYQVSFVNRYVSFSDGEKLFSKI